MLFSKYFDRAAIALSTICIVHCLAMPFVIALLPVAAFTFGGDGHFHSLMLWFVVPTSVLGFALGVRVHRRADIGLTRVVAIARLARAARHAARRAALWHFAGGSPPAPSLGRAGRARGRNPPRRRERARA